MNQDGTAIFVPEGTFFIVKNGGFMKRLLSYEIRNMWLDFFKSKGHYIEPGANLIPHDDPTLLWINSGVAALKKYFDGSEVPPFKRITNAQKSIRTNDIDNVGRTSRHHTFFEMLGNFSIGDYFKSEVLPWIFELLTSEKYFDIPVEKLYVTYYPDDIETRDLWKKIGILEGHLVPCEHNFWEIGEGPCGPNTEVFFDRGEKYDPDHLGEKLIFEDLENDRYIEIWSIVFSQFNAEQGKDRSEYQKLPHRNIDTGAGLERLACIFQDTETNFETDLFYPYIQEIEKHAKFPYNGEYKMAYRVIADHIRACTFALSDGAYFSNEGRGYVLRRLVRRACRYLKKLGINKPYLYTLVAKVADNMKDFYPYLKDHQEKVSKMIKAEEEKFARTLTQGENILRKMLAECGTTLSGEDAFKLYDTYGFPLELTKEIALENHKEVDEDGFNEKMKIQKQLARSSRGDLQSMGNQMIDLMNFKEPSTFTYDEEDIDAKVIGIFKNGTKVDCLDEEGEIIFDKTNFYALSGGQVADTGIIENDGCSGEVYDVIKATNKQHLHFIRVKYGEIHVGDTFTLKIDKKRRHNITRNHSCAHLLQKALQMVLGNDVHQEGSFNGDEYLRFDFNYGEKISYDKLQEIENLVNEMIEEDLPCNISLLNKEDALKLGAMHLFSEKYGDVVRVVNFGDKSIEFCGGTHVKSTKEIGLFTIKYEESIAAGIRRIEGCTSLEAYHQLKAKENLLHDISLLLKSNNYTDCETKIESLLNNIAILKKENDVLANKLSSFQAKELASSFISYNDIHLLIKRFDNLDKKNLSTTFDTLKLVHDNYIIVLANVVNESISYLVGVCPTLTDRYQAGNIVKQICSLTGGSGGGRKDVAQGGGKDVASLDKALEQLKGELMK